MATSRRRWLRFSLRGFFVLFTAVAVGFGSFVNWAREQREAVKAIEAMGAWVWYDCQLVYIPVRGEPQPWPRRISFEEPKANWPWDLIADDYSHQVWMVDFGSVEFHKEPERMEELLRNSIPHLARLHGLQAVFCGFRVSNDTLNRMRAALPNCDIRRSLEH